MPDVLMRDIPEPLLRALDARAADAGVSRSSWLRSQLERLAAVETPPVVRDRYRLVATGPGDALAIIRRAGDSQDGDPVSSGMAECGEAHVAAVRLARRLVQQNAPGDREAAIAVLAGAFAQVLEGAGR